MITQKNMIDRLLSLAVALGLAVLVWLYARSRDVETLDTVPVPVRLSLPDADTDRYDLEITGPSQVLASFTGPPSRVREVREMLNRGELTISVVAAVSPEWRSESKTRDTVRVTTADLHAPPGVRATVIEGQNRIPVTFRKIVERRLPVRLEHALHDRVVSYQLDPPAVVVRGPQDVLDKLSAFPTRLFALPATSPDSALQEVRVESVVPLVQELEGRPVQPVACAVTAQVTLRPPRKLYEVEVPIHFLCPAQFPQQPQWLAKDGAAGKLTLKVLGPPVAELPPVTAYVDLTRPAFRETLKAAQVLYGDEPIRLDLPTGFQLAQDAPRAGTFMLVPLAPEPGRIPFLGGIANQ